jgi:hypothetical protein
MIPCRVNRSRVGLKFFQAPTPLFVTSTFLETLALVLKWRHAASVTKVGGRCDIRQMAPESFEFVA